MNHNFENIFYEAIKLAVSKALDEATDKACKDLTDRLRKEVDHIALNVVAVCDISRTGQTIVIRIDKSQLDK